MGFIFAISISKYEKRALKISRFKRSQLNVISQKSKDRLPPIVHGGLEIPVTVHIKLDSTSKNILLMKHYKRGYFTTKDTKWNLPVIQLIICVFVDAYPVHTNNFLCMGFDFSKRLLNFVRICIRGLYFRDLLAIAKLVKSSTNKVFYRFSMCKN